MSEKFYSNIDREMERERAERSIDLAFKKAEKVLTEKIQLDDFSDLYGKETIEKDSAEVERLEKIYKSQESKEDREIEAKKLSVIFEAIFNQQAETNEWLGENVTTIIPSRYDDIKNGIDSIAEFKEENSKSHLALAIDVTFGSETEKKLAKIKESIKKGELSQVKYFMTEDFRGELKNIPKVIIGADAKTLREISELWIQKRNKELANHPIQMQILLEIKMQLESFKQYAEGLRQVNLVSVYENSLSIINRIIDGKEGIINTDEIKNDRVFNSIQDYMHKFEL